MGRDVASMHLDKKPNAVKVNSNGVSHDSVEESSKLLGFDGQANDSVVEEQYGNQDVLGVKITNGEAGLTKGKALKSEAQKSSDKKLSSPVKETKTTSPHSSRKPLQPDYRKQFDDADNCSVASSTAASVRTVKFKTTVPVAPVFRIVDRAERRREFQSKLEEKHQALEKEKQEYEARTKEDEQAAIKQLRKAMVFKANPVPSFYQEGPPPKTELKKLPLTRAKSPKLTRRKSFPDAPSSSPVEAKVAGARGTRRSLGSTKDSASAASPLKIKDQTTNERNATTTASKLKDRAKSVKDSVKTTPHKMAEQRNADIAVSS